MQSGLTSLLIVAALCGSALCVSTNPNQHQRQTPDKIRQCSCDEQKQMFNELKQTYGQCQEQCEQNADNRQGKMTECYKQHTRAMQEAIDCMQQKTQEQQKSCIEGKNDQKQIQNVDSNACLADHFDWTTAKMREQMEKVYEQEQTDAKEQQFGKQYTNQVMDCANKCLAQKLRQKDNTLQYNCEFNFTDESAMKQTMKECQAKHFKQAFENVCKCATKQAQQQGAEDFCKKLDEKKVVEEFTKQF